MKLNCWEFFKCGREPGGKNVGDFGECAVATSTEYAGSNGGKYAGRRCWRIGGSGQSHPAACVLAEKIENCHDCGFYQLVKSEEGNKFQD
jgi:hypothetical protein